MSIERAIYASLPIGIENSVNGFQFFSYTRDFILPADSRAWREPATDLCAILSGRATHR